jgi:hypothetical protein
MDRGRPLTMRASTCFERAVGVLSAAALIVAVAPARADDVEAFARVVSEQADVRTGPGASYRAIALVARGQTIAIDRRASDQFWLKVTLEDGRSGWILGDDVEVYAVGGAAGAGGQDRPSRPGLFAPPPLLGAHGGLAILAGLLGARSVDAAQVGHYSAADGYFELRGALVVAPEFAIEPYVGITRTDDGRLANVGAWAVVHLFPDWPIDPYVGAGGGHLWSHANADSFALKDDETYTARVGGGFLCGIRGRILFRIEATNLLLFTPDRARSVQTYLAGLGAYF